MVDEQVAGLVAQARRKVVKAEHEYQRSGAVTLLAARPRRAHRHGARRPSPNDFASTAQLAARQLTCPNSTA